MRLITKKILLVMMVLSLTCSFVTSGCVKKEDEKKGSGLNSKASYYENFSATLASLFVNLDGTVPSFSTDKLSETVKFSLNKVKGIPYADTVNMPITAEFAVNLDSKNSRVNGSAKFGFMGKQINAKYTYVDKMLLLELPELLDKYITLDTASLFEIMNGINGYDYDYDYDYDYGYDYYPSGNNLVTTVSKIIENLDFDKIKTMLEKYVQITKNAIPAKCYSTDEISIDTVSGEKTVKADVIRINEEQLIAIAKSVLEKVVSDDSLHSFAVDFAELIGYTADAEEFKDMIQGLIDEIDDIEDELEEFVFKWVQPKLDNKKCGDIITLSVEGTQVFKLTSLYTVSGKKAQGILKLDLHGATYKLELNKDGNNTELVVNINNELKIFVESELVNDGVEKTVSTITIDADGVRVSPLTLTTSVLELSNNSMKVNMNFDIRIPSAITGADEIEVNFDLEIGISNGKFDEIKFPNDSNSNSYDVFNEGELIMTEIMAKLENLFPDLFSMINEL